MFSYQSSLFSLPLSRDSYIRLSYLFLFVKHFFHLFWSGFCGGPSSQCGKPVLRIVTLRCFVLTVISGTCYILSSRLVNVNNFFQLFCFFSFFLPGYCSPRIQEQKDASFASEYDGTRNCRLHNQSWHSAERPRHQRSPIRIFNI